MSDTNNHPRHTAPARAPSRLDVRFSLFAVRFPRSLLYALLALVGIAYALPLVWMASTSIKPADEALSPSVGLLPRLPDGEHPRGVPITAPAYWSRLGAQVHRNYSGVLNSPVADFRLYLRNSLIVAALSVAGMVSSSAVVAYGFSRIRWRGRDTAFLGVLATMMIPFTVIMAPQYLLFRSLGWIGSLAPLWVPAWFGGGFSIFLLRQFFLGIPRELDEAARLDGCSHAGIFWWVILPLARPALAVVALLQFVAAWNDFAGPLVFLNHPSKYTAALGLQMYQTQHADTPWNLVMAASLIVIAPVMAVFLAAQGAMIEGVATQGLKD
jgi:multiple sugar transport system permease protein